MSLPPTSPSSSEPSTMKDCAQVVVHAQIKALQAGAAAGLLLAIPGMALAPIKFNPSDLPPLVALANVAGLGAVASTVVNIPTTIVQCNGKDLRKRAAELTDNARERKLNVVGLAGAVTGLLIEGVRIKSVANIRETKVSNVALTKQSAWESFCFAVCGATVFVAVPTLLASVKKQISAMIESKNSAGEVDADEAKELSEDDAPADGDTKTTSATGQ